MVIYLITNQPMKRTIQKQKFTLGKDLLVEFLLEHGQDPNLRKHERTPLHESARWGKSSL